MFDFRDLEAEGEQTLERIGLAALEAKLQRLKAQPGEGCLIGLASAERISAPLPSSAVLEAQQLCDGRRGERAEGFERLAHQEACFPDDLQALGCVRVLIEGPGWWVRQSSGRAGWALFLQSWNRRGWVAWWEGGQVHGPAFPFISPPDES